MDKNPTTLDIAIQYIKSAITNQKLILGLKKCELKKVKFEDSEGEKESDKETPNKVRAVFNSKQNTMQNSEQTKFTKLESRVKKIEEDNREIKNNIADILQILKSSNQTSSNRSRSNSRKSRNIVSPSNSPSRQTCFKCNEMGHFTRECPNFKKITIPKVRITITYLVKLQQVGEVGHSSTFSDTSDRPRPKVKFKRSRPLQRRM